MKNLNIPIIKFWTKFLNLNIGNKSEKENFSMMHGKKVIRKFFHRQTWSDRWSQICTTFQFDKFPKLDWIVGQVSFARQPLCVGALDHAIKLWTPYVQNFGAIFFIQAINYVAAFFWRHFMGKLFYAKWPLIQTRTKLPRN